MLRRTRRWIVGLLRQSKGRRGPNFLRIDVLASRMQEDTMSVKFTGAFKTDPPFCECTEFRIIRMIASCPSNHLLMQAIARRLRAAIAALLPTTIPI